MSTLLNIARVMAFLSTYLLFAMILNSCSNSTPIVRALTLVYECSGSFNDKNNDGEYIARMGGTRDYDDEHNRRKTLSFTFQSNQDYLDICVSDDAYLDPKKSYSLLLVHENSDNVPIGQKAKWPLVITNNSDEALKEACFRIQPGNGDLSIESGTPIAGSWRIFKTDREIKVNYHSLIHSTVTNSNPSPPNCSG